MSPDYATRLRDQALAGHQPGKPCSPEDTKVLELALREMSLALDALAEECAAGNGPPQAPSRKALMRARGLLPPYCKLALSKSPDDRARLPAPPRCLRCAHLETWRAAEVERHQCLRGHPLQIGCTWQRERTLTVEERQDDPLL